MTHLNKDETYIKRCFQLAKLAGNDVAKNPNVGAVLVFEDRIIGEGYHKVFGDHHAEVNAIASVKPEDKQWIEQATLYVSLEPCCIHSKTPACTDLILKNGIKKVVISTLDPNPLVAGNGVKILRDNGIEVTQKVLKKEGENLIRSFSTLMLQKRPYVILKFAQTSDGYISKQAQQIQISSKVAQVLNHKWRTEVDGILVGTQTAIIDNPKLTSRAYPGSNPARLVIDRHERIPKSHDLLSDDKPCLIFTEKEDYKVENARLKDCVILTEDKQIQQILEACFQRDINILIIEGGKQLIESFIQENLWDECRIIKSKKRLEQGLKAPLIHMTLEKQLDLGEDQVFFGFNPK